VAEKIFVSGATGFIGARLVDRLVRDGYTVHALYRSQEKAKSIRGDGVILFKGDILDTDSLKKAMKGCSKAYHAAAFASVWSRDPSKVHRLNVDGSLNVVRAAADCGVKRMVITSTAGILGPAVNGPVHEDSPPPGHFFTPYEESKFALELALKELPETSPEVLIVNPTRVYGPGLLSESNGVTRMIGRYLQGKWRFIPGSGNSLGNYVLVDDVVDGHLLAMHKGKSGERYVLGGEDISYNQLFEISRQEGHVSYRLFHLPLWLMLAVAHTLMGITRLTGLPPMITPNLVRKFNHNFEVSSAKAKKELGYKPLDAREGIRRTIAWLNTQ